MLTRRRKESNSELFVFADGVSFSAFPIGI